MAGLEERSSEMVTGYLDTTHGSSLSAYWIHYPTPWPWVLTSILVSLLLAIIGIQTSYSSWAPKKKKKEKKNKKSSTTSEDGVVEKAEVPQPQPSWWSRYKSRFFRHALIYNSTHRPPPPGIDAFEEIQFRHEQNRIYQACLEQENQARFQREGRIATYEDDHTIHAGFGTFSLARTLFGLTWTTVRAVASVSLMTKIMVGQSYTVPGIISIVVLFASTQTYLGTRSMPRIMYLVVVLDLWMTFTSMTLVEYTFFKNQKSEYSEFGVRGGNCPCLLGTRFDLAEGCKAFATDHKTTSGAGGCQVDYYWPSNITNMTYPTTCLSASSDFSDDGVQNINPNSITYLFLAEVLVGGCGLLYALLVLYYSARWLPLTLKSPSDLLKPLAMSDRPKMIHRATSATAFAFFAMLAIGVVTVTVHVKDETRPYRGFYMDSFGNVDEAGSWSDCFQVDAPWTKDGQFAVWWAIKESRLLRALGAI